ncbi:MetS family NSS transporter small subunit [Acetohalobium arabaticum]|uniref:Uncharacterized protein n=1 Tax=Acetohalobium arabaticum (strain ATCC 49924 / DSM 5501 / Z-7288) TaxID=574087 RepID=D9QRT4_ACEAZ|nr:MetS family NSS transporter small subunit [Acetohalobium arabaticum]ADL13225.1 hypothetical protein Acear_1720 [Acetohalobium arabaticum DSM 5501]
MSNSAVMMLLFAIVVLGGGLGICLNIAFKNQ